MKNLLCLILLIVTLFCSGYRKPYKYVIDAEKDAYFHNNVGLNYFNDRVYYAAIQEFKIAVQLSPNTQATAVFKSNLGESYMLIGYPDMARVCFEDAIKQNGLNLKYYLNLVQCYDTLNIVQSKIAEYTGSENFRDKIMLGLLYIQSGQQRRGIIILDEVCMTEPDILITPAIRQYINQLPKEF